jgi:regulation of enolase protein 1 (concanavalin A-like superfamily)
MGVQRAGAWSFLVLGLFLSSAASALAQSTPPRPDHVVIVIEENHDYSQINASASAPYINSLKTQGAWFTSSHAIEHPSQPNYLDLYSGSNQGVTDDTVPPPGSQYTTANLGGGLKAKGFTFGGYSETMPSVGYTGGSSGTAPNTYQRKHNPWVDWQGTGTNQIPSAWNMPYAGFFPTDYTLLPTVSIVVPNQENDMHDGSITTGDTWAKNNLDAYAQWAKTHNSLFILTFDENNGGGTNQIVTVFVGQMVKIGQYSETINHYTLLRTIEDMYGLAHAGAAASATPILDCWSSSTPVPPSITSQPANRSVTAGQTAAFSVTAGGTAPLSYQWQKNTVNIAGATSAAYTTPPTLLADNGATFRCVVTNSAGTATSNNATLTVTAVPVPPAITSQPANQTVTAGQTATFSVTASGTAPLTYQWQKNTANISGATSASYTTPATALADSGSTYRCVVTNSAGSMTSASATLTVNPSLSSLPSPWLDQDIGSPGVAGSAVYVAASGTFTIIGSGTGITGTSDHFNFTYQPLSGDGEIIARVTGLGTAPGAMAGVMIRESLAANSTFAFTALAAGGTTEFVTRTTTGGTDAATAGPAAAAPFWVRLVRIGSTFTSYVSADGTTWTQIGSAVTIAMAANVDIGFAVTSGSNTSSDTAMLDSARGSGGWTVPASAGGAAPSGGGGGGGCGATGLEALLAFAAFLRIRRRRSRS